MQKTDLESGFVAQLQRLNGWRLWLLFSVVTVLLAVLIVSLMDLLLMGRVTADYLLTGLVTAGIVAPASLFFMSALLREIALHRQQELSRKVGSAEARLQVALDSADEGILMVAADGAVLSANRRFLELWRVPPELAAAGRDDLLLRHVLDQLSDPDDFLAGVQRLYGSDAQANDILQFKDGRVFERYTRALDLGDEQGRIWCFRDVSEQTHTREDLAEREEQYRAIVNQAGDGIDLIDAQTLCFLEVNEAACRMLGYRRDELIGQSVATIQGGMDEATLRDAVAEVVRQGQARFEHQHRCKDGRVLDVHLNIRVVRLRGRACLVGVWRDVTEQKRSALALADSGLFLRETQSIAHVGGWKANPETDMLLWTEEVYRLVEHPLDSPPSGLEEGLRYYAPEYLPEIKRLLSLAWEQGTPFTFETEMIAASGRRFWAELRCIGRVEAENGVFLTGTFQDITERKEAERKLKLAVEVTQVILWELDIPSQRLKFDRDMLPVLGLQTDEDLASLAAWMQRVHPDEAGLFMERFQAALLPGAVFDLEYRLRSKDGDYRWIHTRGSVIQRSPDGQPETAVGTSMNITARKQAEAELDRHRRHLEELVQQRTSELLATEARATRILESAADGLYGVDSDSRITFINPAACRMLGYSAEQVMGRHAHELFHHSYPDGRPYPAAECRARESWRAGRESRVDDETYWHADGHPIPVTLASHPLIEKGEIVGAVVSIVDTTAQRAAAQAREKALVAAENLARARSEFIANMSHEIRTPMNGVLGFAQIGQRNCKDPEKARNAFDKIIASGHQLLGVVNDVLDFSKIDAGKLHVEAREMSLDEALDHALELVAERARAKGLVARLEKAADLPSACVCDPLRLGQILLNLLANAIKFTEAGSVTLSAARQGGQLVFRVRDTGIGMTPEQIDYVFDPFQQADGSTTRKFGGTGLGLAICKRLVELMKGDIRVESTLGAGSLFEVSLPYVEPAPHSGSAAAIPVTASDKPLAGISILLAEDDAINQMVLEDNLLDDGAHLVTVGDGAAAVARVIIDGPQAYDIVLMDIQMPVMDGYEATQRIHELAPGLPIIGQTAHAFDEDREKCFAAGMAGHIAKPIDPRELVALIVRVLAARHEAG